ARGSIGPADTDAKDSAEEYPAQRALELQREVNLRYGENPHQTAAFYRVVGTPPVGLAAMKQLHGPELGYNNVLDFSAALGLLLRTKKKCRVFELRCERAGLPGRLPEYRSVLGGLLAQSTDLADLDPAQLKTVTERAPTPSEMAALRFAWRVAKHAKSNAI